jgi:histidinol-phosphatase
MSNSYITEILQFALSLADVAERQIMPVYRNCTVNLKSDGTEVTDADRGAEEAMREVIAKRYPGHLILGEEFGGPKSATVEPTWILDPIDGTASFAIGVPIFGTLVGYVENGEPVAGVIHFPAMGETVFAAKGLGCWQKLRGGDSRRVAVTGNAELSSAFVSACSVWPSDIHPGNGRCYRLSAVIPKARKFRFITDCLQHALVAQGRIDAAIDLIMYPWDIAAIVPCVEEAGGVVSDLDGRRPGIVWQPNLLTSGSERLHSQIVRALGVPEYFNER